MKKSNRSHNNVINSKKNIAISRKKRGGYLFVGLILFFFTKVMWKNIDAVKDYDFDRNFPYLLLAIVVQLFFVHNLGYLRSKLVIGVSFSRKKTQYINAIARIAKYIPGKLGLIVTKIYYLKQEGVGEPQAVRISFQENLLQILAALVVSLPIVFHYGELLHVSPLRMIVTILLVLFVCLQPSICHTIIHFLFKKRQKMKKTAREYPEMEMMKSQKIIVLLLGYVVNACLNGLFFFLCMRAVLFIDVSHLIPLVAIRNFAGIVGLFAVFAPAGLGVREGIVVLLLQQYVPLPIAIIVSIIARLLVSGADILWGVFVFYYSSLGGVKKKENIGG